MSPRRRSARLSQSAKTNTHDADQEDEPAKPIKVAKKTARSQRPSKASDNATDAQDTSTAQDVDRPTFSVPMGDDKKPDKSILCQHFPSPSSSPADPPALIFTHGAGGGIHAPAVTAFARGFSSVSASAVTTFQGSMHLGQRTKHFATVLAHYHRASSLPPAVGGRSMGARAAVLAATNDTDHRVTSVVAVSFPLRSGDKGDDPMRAGILLGLPGGVDVLFVTGDADGLCDLAALGAVRAKMAARSWGVVVRGADHGMGLVGGVAGRGRKATAEEELRVATGKVAAAWVKGRDGGATEMEVWWDDEEGRAVVGEWREAAAGKEKAGETRPRMVKGSKRGRNEAQGEADGEADPGDASDRRPSRKRPLRSAA